MSLQRSWEGRALVLSGADSRDDRIVRLLMEDDELVPAISRFARKSSGRGKGAASRSTILQPLTSLHVRLRAKGSDELAVLEEAAVEHPFALVKRDLMRVALGSAMCEVVLHLVPDWGTEPGIHALLARALGHLDRPEVEVGEELLLLFELRALDLGGVLPPLEDLPELPLEAREALAAWRAGRWVSLPEGAMRPTARFLEATLTAASGRPLLSRSLLEAALG